MSLVEEILINGDRAEVRELFKFNRETPHQEILFKYRTWSRWFFSDYFLDDNGKNVSDAPFHKDFDRGNLNVYLGVSTHFVNIGFRGSAKDARTKTFLAFCVANDEDHYRKFIKVLASDGDNSKQIVTDVYNILVNPAVAYYYPEIFAKTHDKKKQEERMSTFTTSTGVKLSSGTVGMEQRGDIQEHARPDLVWYNDFESRQTLRSPTKTQTIWDNMEEARTGLSKTGGSIYTCNYVSERGNVHKLVDTRDNVLITPIEIDGVPTWNRFTEDDLKVIKKETDDYAGEFLCQPSAGDDIFFDRKMVDKQEKKMPIRELSGFKIFHEYEPSHRYGSGHDVGGGVGLDHSTSVFIDFSTVPARVVGTYKSNRIKPDSFGDEIKSQAERFGEPIVAVENNKFDMCIGRLKQIYGSLYTSMGSSKKIKAVQPSEWGWNTNSLTKSNMLYALKKAIEDGLIELSDPDLISEARSYSRDDMMDSHSIDPRLTTRHFDLLIAAAIAWMMREHAEESDQQLREYEIEERRRESIQMAQEDYGL